MKRSLIVVIFTVAGLYSCGQSDKATTNQVNSVIDTSVSITLNDNLIKTEPFSYDSYIHTTADYTDSTGKGIIIQNSYPRGGGLIHTSNELRYGHAVFWSRVINKTDKPLKLNIHFPPDSFLIQPSPHVHFKLLVPQDPMTSDKITTFSFGLKGIESFVANNFHQPSQLQKTIPPNEDTMFYVILLSHLSTSYTGVSRTGLFLKEENLFYKLSINESVNKLLPCGKIMVQD